MLSRSALKRGVQLGLCRSGSAAIAKRTFATPAGDSDGSFQPTEIAGVKIASKDARGPTTRLAVVARAGTRYQPAPGLAVGLEEFAFKNTQKRSALRITRESELLGGQLQAYHTREVLVVQASFLRDDLPYYTELLAEVIGQTRYTTHEFHEEVESIIHMKQARLSRDPLFLALDLAHATAFHAGLGFALYPTTTTPIRGYLNEQSVADFAGAVYNKANFSLAVDGASNASLSKWVEPFFKSVPSTGPSAKSLDSPATKYYGGEQRTAQQGQNVVVLGFPGAPLGSGKPEITVLTALLGGDSSISWSPGFSLLSKAAALAPGAQSHARNHAYSDAGLLTIEIRGASSAVRKAAEESVKALQSVASGSVSKEDLTKAIAKTKFDILSASELSGVGLVAAGSSVLHGGHPFQVTEAIKAVEGVTADKLKSAAKSLLDGRATVVAVGDLHVLPYAEELGLKV